MAQRPLRKRLLQSAAIHYLLSHIAALYLRFVYLTSRVTRDVHPDALPYMRGERPGLFCFWHGRLIMQQFQCPPGRRLVVLISRHNDGALITAVIRRFGVGAVRGSAKSGSTSAVRQLLALEAAGDNIAITPDGPRGPFQTAAPGASFVAMKTGYPLLPLTFSASRHWRLKSWDRFMIPKPFGRLHFAAAAPLPAAAADSDAATLATSTRRLDDALATLTAAGDAACGVEA